MSAPTTNTAAATPTTDSIAQVKTTVTAAITAVMRMLFEAQAELARGNYRQSLQLVVTALADYRRLKEAVEFSFSINYCADNQLEEADELPATVSGKEAWEVLVSAIRTLRLEGNYSQGVDRVIEDQAKKATADNRTVLFAFNDCLILVEPGADTAALQTLYHQHKTAIRALLN